MPNPKTFLKIIDHKKISLTQDEWMLYESICKSYDGAYGTHIKGKELFRDLFEVDSQGIITMLIPPSTEPASMEIFLFLMTIQQNQQLRLMWDRIGEKFKEPLKKDS